jgi:hypothetical protein
MKISWGWKEGVRFALADHFLLKDTLPVSYQKNGIEHLGTLCVKPLYKIVSYISTHIRKPTAIVLFTLLAALLSVFVFYNFPIIAILGKLFPYQTVRFLLFVYVEITLLGMGFRAMGRFSNPPLIALWKEGALTAVFPGDNSHR